MLELITAGIGIWYLTTRVLKIDVGLKPNAVTQALDKGRAAMQETSEKVKDVVQTRETREAAKGPREGAGDLRPDRLQRLRKCE